MAITKTDQLKVIMAKIQAYEREYYGLGIEYEVATDVDDKSARVQIKEHLKRVKIALNILAGHKKELEKAGE